MRLENSPLGNRHLGSSHLGNRHLGGNHFGGNHFGDSHRGLSNLGGDIDGARGHLGRRCATGAGLFALAALFGFGLGLLLGRTDHHDHVAAVLLGRALDKAELADVLGEALQQAKAELRPGLLATAEHDRHLDLVTSLEEPLDMALLGGVVVRVDLRPELDLLDDRVDLVLARFPLLDGFLVLELAEVHELGDRRLCHRGHLDQVEVAPMAKPPVAKLMDFGKFKYQEAIKEREARKNQVNTVIKEIKLRPKIDPHDYATKKGHVERFLKAGDKVKVTIMFRGREQSRPELGFRLLQRLAEDIGEFGFVESTPKQDGRNMIMVIGPTKKKAEAKAEQRRKREEAGPGGAAPTKVATSTVDVAPQVAETPVAVPEVVTPEVVTPEVPVAKVAAPKVPVAKRAVLEAHVDKGDANKLLP